MYCGFYICVKLNSEVLKHPLKFHFEGINPGLLLKVFKSQSPWCRPHLSFGKQNLVSISLVLIFVGHNVHSQFLLKAFRNPRVSKLMLNLHQHLKPVWCLHVCPLLFSKSTQVHPGPRLKAVHVQNKLTARGDPS